MTILDRAKSRMLGKQATNKRADYLTPMRYNREYAESLMGVYDGDGDQDIYLKEVKGRARLKQGTVNKESNFFLSHLASKGRIR